MATERTLVATEDELTAHAARGASLGELLDHVDRRNRQLGRGSFSEEQDDELQLYCWMIYKRRSLGSLWGEEKVPAFLEEDICG
jgi:hypothetical protein